MTLRRMGFASAIVVAAMTAIAALAWHRLPPGARLPTHWNAAGEVDGRADAAVALFLPVGLTIALSLLLVVLPRIEPMQRGMVRSATLLTTVWAGLLASMALIEVLIAGPSLGVQLPPTLPLAAVGVLLMVIGNALPKSRPGFFVGIRTPWTLTDEYNWIATHRLGAWTTIAGGALIVVAAFLPLAPSVRTGLLTAALVVAIVPPVIYSYLHWRRSVGP